MKAPIAQPGSMPGNAHVCATGAFIGLHGQNIFEITGNAPDCAIGAFIGLHGQKRI
jgi:hypothetical protein